MSNKRLLLLSSSKTANEGYLTHAETAIKQFFGQTAGRMIFIPFAGIRISYDDYSTIVRQRFQEIGYAIDSAHDQADPIEAVSKAEGIVVGGGNTFHLLKKLSEMNLMEPIRSRVNQGIPYLGWSAGSNLACPTIKTTNDMPIVEPPGFQALNLIPFQINPHYTDSQPLGHQGETREERIAEFTEVNPGMYVVGLREGSWLNIEGSRIQLCGQKPARIFVHGQEPREVTPTDSLQFLLNELF